MIVERTNKEVIFRLPATSRIDILQDLVDFFDYKTITRKSKVKQTEIDLLVRKIKKGRWGKTKKSLGL